MNLKLNFKKTGQKAVLFKSTGKYLEANSTHLSVRIYYILLYLFCFEEIKRRVGKRRQKLNNENSG